MPPDKEAEALLRQAKEIQESLKPLLSNVAEARRRVAEDPAAPENKAELAASESEAAAALETLRAVEKELIDLVGLSEEAIELVSEELIDSGDDVDRRPRVSVTGPQIEPTGHVDDHLSMTRDVLAAIVPVGWLRRERAQDYRLTESTTTSSLGRRWCRRRWR